MNSRVQYKQQQFGNRIREIRKEAGVNQQQLAEQLMLSIDMLSKIETGKSVCMPEHLTRICQIFNISADYFYFGNKKYLIEKNTQIDEKIRQLLMKADDNKKDQIYRMVLILMEDMA